MIHFLGGGVILTTKDISLFKENFLFSGDESSSIEEFLKKPCCRLAEYSKGDIIYGEKCFKNEIGILLSGKASALCDDCKKTSLKTFREGELFGAAGIFCENNDTPFSNIKASSSCKVLYITKEGVEALLKENPEKAIRYIRFLSGRVEFLNRRIATFTSREALIRVARYILENADEDDICYGVNFSALAKSLDISRASLYRARAELTELNTISINGRDIAVINRNALENII